MAAALPITGQGACHFGADGVGLGIQGDRIKITLQGDFAAGAATGFLQRHQPIQTDAFGAAGGQRFKRRRIAFAE